MPTTLNTLEQRLEILSDRLNTQGYNLNLHLTDCQDDINEINIKIAALEREDRELHDEIHDVALDVDDNLGRINAILSRDYQGQIDTLNSTLTSSDNSLQTQIEDMDVEHHEELHLLANGLDAQSIQINNIEVKQAAIPEHVVLSINDYEALGTPDPDKIYFAYEEES